MVILREQLSYIEGEDTMHNALHTKFTMFKYITPPSIYVIFFFLLNYVSFISSVSTRKFQAAMQFVALVEVMVRVLK